MADGVFESWPRGRSPCGPVARIRDRGEAQGDSGTPTIGAVMPDWDRAAREVGQKVTERR